MNFKLVLVSAVSLLIGVLARDLVVTRAEAAEDVLRRDDVLSIVRALENQARSLEQQVNVGEKQVDATRDLARSVSELSRSCK
jgi:uncharacterized protein YlxW (UPF0749 family)